MAASLALSRVLRAFGPALLLCSCCEAVRGSAARDRSLRASASAGDGWEAERPPFASPADFRLERYFAKHEFVAKHLLCCSDVEPLAMAELLEGADEESLSLWGGLHLGYTETRGLPALLGEIANSYESIDAVHVIECVPQEGVTLAACALVEPGDGIIVMWPSYQSLVEVALCRGAVAQPWRARGGGSGDGPMRFDVCDLEEAIVRLLERGAPLKLIVTNLPHNPSGCTLAPSEWARVVALAEQHGAWLFSDEMYRGLEPIGGAPQLQAAADAYARGVSLSGLSKVYGLPGLRLGWLACREAGFVERVAALKDFTTICSAAPSQVLALVAMRRRVELAARARAFIEAGEAAADEFFHRHRDLFDYHRPQAGPIAFPALRREGARAADAELYCERLVATDSLMLLPATVYGGGFDGPNMRIGLGRADCAE
ncbi:pyridoxal phosphate-dependent transferase, partial [Pavlovales sp. CCMP2436]